MAERDDLAALVEGWPGIHCLAVADDRGIVASTGDLDGRHRVASVTKLFTAYAALIAIEEGTLALDAPAGPPDSTVRHLLAHASGLPFEGRDPIAEPGTRRIYSNTGFEVLAEHLAASAGMSFAEYLYEGALVPLGLGHLDADVSPAHGLCLSVRSLLTFAVELLDPTLVATETMAAATSVQFPELRGVLPGFGLHEPNPWGLGFEIRGVKQPHWTGRGQHPRTFGHFGGAGSFLWVDPVNRLVGASLGTEPFGTWAAEAWPAVNAELFNRYS